MKHVALLSVFCIALSAGCATDAPIHEPHSDAGRYQHLTPATAASFEVEPFRQVGLLMDTPATQIEARIDGGVWQPVEVTWEEDEHKVARLLLDEPATSLELRADRPWTFGTVQFFDQIEAGETLARDLPFAEPEVSVSGLAPASLVISRAQWGARSPNKVCGNWHDPYRITMHHTSVPADDGSDPAARLRQIQAYHIDTRDWCDIGYHFVVSQSGKIYQGRSNEQRTGAHADAQNSGNIGISLIGDFDRQSVNSTQFAAAARILGWAARTYDVPFNRNSIRGHQELRGQSTNCPGRNFQARLSELIATAQGSTYVPPADTREPSPVLFQVNWRSSETDIYSRGSSAGILDVFPNDWMRAEIKFKNTTSYPLRGVEIGYNIDHLTPLSYVIESDAPRFNGVSFGINDANSNPANPPHQAMPKRGSLGMYALAPGETKRVTIDFQAGAYSIGEVEHARLEAWVHHIDNYYGDQNGYDDEPSVNTFEEPLQDFAVVDVLSENEWQFDAGETEQVEGWTGCGAANPQIDASNGTLTVRTSAAECIESPPWTSLDAGVFGQMVIRMKVDAPHTAALYWADNGQGFVDTRAVVFDVSPDQDIYVLDLSTQRSWQGHIGRLRLVPSIREAASTAIDAIFFQTVDGYVGSAREQYVATSDVRISNDAPAPFDGQNAGAIETVAAEPQTSGSDVRVIEASGELGGCSTTARGPGNLVWLFGVLFAMRRRRR